MRKVGKECLSKRLLEISCIRKKGSSFRCFEVNLGGLKLIRDSDEVSGTWSRVDINGFDYWHTRFVGEVGAMLKGNSSPEFNLGISTRPKSIFTPTSTTDPHLPSQLHILTDSNESIHSNVPAPTQPTRLTSSNEIYCTSQSDDDKTPALHRCSSTFPF